MATVPKWLGDTMEVVYQRFMHEMVVTDIEYLDEKLKRVRFEGDLRKVKFIPGYVVKVRVNDTEYRHYTLSAFDTTVGYCEIVFYLHGMGPGSSWAEALRMGDKVKLLGPGGKLHYSESKENHFLFGDETSLGWMKCMEEEAERREEFFFGFAELDEPHQDWASRLGSSVKIVEKSSDNPAQPVIDILKEWEEDFWETAGNTVFYLTGRTKSIQAFRKFLLSKGISSNRIKSEPYWAEGKSGL